MFFRFIRLQTQYGENKNLSHYPPKNILCTTDFSPQGDRALPWATHLAKVFQAKLHLVHVVEPLLGPLFEFSYTQNLPIVEEELQYQAQKKLNKLAKEMEGIAVTAHIPQGNSTQEILRLAKEIPADIIVIGAQGHSAFARFTLGSTTENILRQATCPVYILPQDGK